MSDKPFKCWRIVGQHFASDKYKAIYYFCAQDDTFKISETFRSAAGDVKKVVDIRINNPDGTPLAYLGTNVLFVGHGLLNSENSYVSEDDLGLYRIEGDCNGCGCDAKTHCRVNCPSAPLGYCCLEKTMLKQIAIATREISGNRR